MAFRELKKAFVRRLASFNNATSFSRKVNEVITALYRGRTVGVRVRDVVHEPGRRRITLHVNARDHAQVEKDREMIRAALRKEGLDIKTVVIREH